MPLVDLAERDGQVVPFIIQDFVHVIEERGSFFVCFAFAFAFAFWSFDPVSVSLTSFNGFPGMKEEGIFRVGGMQSTIDALQEAYSHARCVCCCFWFIYLPLAV